MAKPESITSPANPLLKDVRRAIVRGSLTAQGWCVAETFHLLEEALRSDCEVKTVLAAESVRSIAEAHVRRLAGIKVVVLPDALFQSISGTETAQGVMALVKPPQWTMEQLFRGTPLLVVLDGLQDPGNAGTIVRAAEAFGATGVLFLKGAVNPWNPKTLRASAGSLFRLPMLIGLDSQKALELLHRNGVSVRATLPDTGRAPATLDWRGPVSLVIGSEGQGLSEPFRAAEAVRIPTRAVESLNAAVAGAILLYEAARQRDGTFL